MQKESEIKKSFVHDLFTPKSVIAICAAFAWAVIFWKDSQANWKETILLKEAVETKVSNDDYKALAERVTRQYEQMNKLNERINQLEKDAAYQKGLHEAKQHLETEK